MTRASWTGQSNSRASRAAVGLASAGRPKKVTSTPRDVLVDKHADMSVGLELAGELQHPAAAGGISLHMVLLRIRWMARATNRWLGIR